MRRTLTYLTALITLTGITACSDPDSSTKTEKLSADLTIGPVDKIVKLDKRLTLIEVSGLQSKKQPVAQLFQHYIDSKWVNLKTGQILADTNAPKQGDQTNTVTLSPDQDIAQISQRENVSKIYLIKDDQGQEKQVVLPIRARGKYSMLYGYLALSLHTQTVTGLAFYQHGETPGLGADIVDDPNWTKQIIGKKVFTDGKPDFSVIIHHATPVNDHAIDGISGATYTSKGVQHAINYWCGDMAFGPVLKTLFSHS